MVMPAGIARAAEDPLGQGTFLTKSAEGVPAAFIHQEAECDPSHENGQLELVNSGFF